MKLKMVTNHWGWSLRGIATWIRAGWSRPFDVWDTEFSEQRAYLRRYKLGPLVLVQTKPNDDARARWQSRWGTT